MDEHDHDDKDYIAPPMPPLRSQRAEVRDPKLGQRELDQALAHHQQQEEATEGRRRWWQRLFHRG